MEVARAEAEKIKLIGASDASAIECVGKAEAEMMRLKAAAYKQYGKAAILSLVLDALPKVCLLSSFLFSQILDGALCRAFQVQQELVSPLQVIHLPHVWTFYFPWHE